jgi:hypothetical protein
MLTLLRQLIIFVVEELTMHNVVTFIVAMQMKPNL